MDVAGHTGLFRSKAIAVQDEIVARAYERLSKAQLSVAGAEAVRLQLWLKDLKEHFPTITKVNFEGIICYDDRDPFEEVLLRVIGWPEDLSEDDRSLIEGELSLFDVKAWAQDPEANPYTCGYIDLHTWKVVIDHPEYATEIEAEDETSEQRT